MFEHTYIGLDVHAQSIVGCAMNTQTGEVFREKMASDPVAVRSWVQRFDAPVRVAYEAGPTGFGLARYLIEAGIDCVVAAGSKLLRAPGDRVKTDRRDAMALAHMLSLGEIVPVRVPSPDQEALRDLSRARATAAKELAHSRQRINALLLRKGLHYPEKTHWTQTHIAWLNHQHFDQRPAQLTLEADVELQILQLQHLKSLEQHITNLAPD
ncbi:IS110 family transposase [Arthrobacter castelli]|uniref:IS110 family transposase n=1 Tax=Arthrobacter castelli TaxID=271431 RepID=UPI00040E19C2|nr:transposase [Arthrobacter castelli]